jgi:aryl-alcohol dehydrogenase-like predicted oxidoreductase
MMRFVKVRAGERDIVVSQLGFGCARLFGGVEKRHSCGVLERAYDLGIRHFDTAPSYGHSQAENVLGDVFAGVADITVMTKVGIPRPAGVPSLASVARRLTLRRVLSHAPALKKRFLARAQVSAPPVAARPTQVLECDVVLRSLDDSLKRLRRDRIDFYCVHEPDQYVIDDDLLTVFDNLKASGGISVHGLAWGRAAPTAPAGWDVIQAQYVPQCPRDGRLWFFHGVLRSSQSDAPVRLAAAMREERDAVFIVSASERHQLTDLSRRVAVEL